MQTDTVNPNTGKTNQQVLDSSNAVAERAAAMLGGTWEQGYKKADGSVGGGLKVTSSSSVMNDKNKKDARVEAGNSLTSDGSYNNIVNQGINYGNTMYQNQQEYMQDQQSFLDAVDIRFDTALARSNQQYGNAITDLRSSMQQDVGMATQQAAALNPYSEAQGAMTARNFKGAIRDKYKQQEARLREAADMAQRELEAGRYEAYVNIQNGMKESQRQFNAGMQKFMLDMAQTANQQQQWEQGHQLDQARFGLETQKFDLDSAIAFEGQFYDFIDTFGADPNFQSAVDSYFETGVISEEIAPLIERGLKAGLSPGEAMSVAQYETASQQKMRIEQEQFQQQMDLGWFNANTSRMGENRAAVEKEDANAAASLEYQTNLAHKIATAASIALPMINGFTTGYAANLRAVKGTPQYQLDQALEPIRAAISFDGLQDMRDASKTGGALGQVAIRELELLSSLEGSLDTGQDPEILRATVTAIGESRARFANAVRIHNGQQPVNYEGLTEDGSKNALGGPATTYTSSSGTVYNLPNQ